MSAQIGRPRAPSSVNAYGGTDSIENRSPINLNMLKSLTMEGKQTKDGQPAKRRGPKPDSKPALTRRQELNRQAQRTHRERKEMYIKALEQEVLRLKELYGTVAREREYVSAENAKLKELLAAHGIPFEVALRSINGHNAYNGSSSGSISGSYTHGSTAPTSAYSPPPMASHEMQTPVTRQNPTFAQMHNNSTLDFDQLGIDFVLTLERPCMDHMQYLVVRSHNPEGQFFHHPMENPDDGEHEHLCGHALMASCPPASHIMNKPAEPYPHKMPEMTKSDLARLLDLSSKLPLTGEITPVMAWAMIVKSERVHELDMQDYETIKTQLAGKAICYGFGAVLEEFEVRDAINNLFAAKENESMMQQQAQAGAMRQIPVY